MSKTIELNNEEILYLLECLANKAEWTAVGFETLGNPEELAKLQRRYNFHFNICKKLEDANEIELDNCEQTSDLEEPDRQLKLIWDKVSGILEKEIIQPIFDTWIKSAIPLKMTEHRLEIGMPNNFNKQWIEARYMERIQQIVKEVTQKNIEVTVVVREE